jgi:sodium-dependent dicarboxylate transporter 2/3/5
MAAVALLMAIWWITEAIPIPATALLPVVLFPALGILPGKDTAGVYFNHVIFLFLGGFMFALCMQRWNLHRRIALRIILAVGASPRRLLLGFMIAAWFLSMWVSNTATTMMMVPMALAIVLQLEDRFGEGAVARYAPGLLIGIAYAASIGGMATLIGTPPNLSFTRILTIVFPAAPEISFAAWLAFAFPLSLVLLLIAWQLLGLLFVRDAGGFTAGEEVFREEYRKLGRLRYEEGVVLALFALLVALWVLRSGIPIGDQTYLQWTALLPRPDYVDDGTVAILIAVLLFLIPSRSRPGERLLDWETASRVQWGIVLLFGGGFALASGFKESGLSEWLGQRMIGLSDLPPVAIVASVCAVLTGLTELTSNTATTEMILPVVGSMAVAIGVNPLLLMIPATLSASCAFALPVATPPNAIVFGSGRVRMIDMVRGGLILNLIGVVLITLAIYTLGAMVLGIDPGTMPGWAVAGEAP